jgi:hypothetical protein
MEWVNMLPESWHGRPLEELIGELIQRGFQQPEGDDTDNDDDGEVMPVLPAIMHDEYPIKLFARGLLQPGREREAIKALGSKKKYDEVMKDPTVRAMIKLWWVPEERQFVPPPVQPKK